jgi:predicted RNA-binding Zn-ribbon protein involved in translation (DUF1610 family)
MPIFRVEVKVIAEYTYVLDVDARNEERAESIACGRESMANHLPEDFQVEKGYCTFEVESDQLTAICPECGEEHPIPNDNTGHTIPEAWHEDYEYCAPCGAKIEAAEAAELNRA